MACDYKTVCPFHRHKIPIHEAMYKSHTTKYCDGNHTVCAVYQVIQEMGYLKVPPDLYPNQTFRLPQILPKK